MGCDDTPSFDIALKFIECCDYIDGALKQKPSGKVLIHCFKGQSRACTIAMSYLMLRRGLGFDDAFLRAIYNEELAMCGAGGVGARARDRGAACRGGRPRRRRGGRWPRAVVHGRAATQRAAAVGAGAPR